MFLTDGGDGRQRIHGVRRGRAHGSAYKERYQPGLEVLLHLKLQGLWLDGIVVVHFQQAQVIQRRFPLSLPPFPARSGPGWRCRQRVCRRHHAGCGVAGSSLSRRQHGTKCRAGSSVLNDPATGTRRKKLVWQAQHAHQPIEDMGFQLSAGGTGGPEHSLDSQRRRQQVSQDCWS